MTRRQPTILQLVPALESGGVERGVVEVAGAIVRAGCRSLVISEGGPMVGALEATGTEHFTSRMGRKSLGALTYILWLRRFILDQRVDVIDYHSRVPGWIALAAWSLLPKRRRPHLISSLHGLHRPNAFSRVMCRGQSVVAVSETVRQYIAENFPVASDRVRVIPRGIDDAEFPRGFQPATSWLAAFYSEFPQLVGKRVITLAGRVTRLKGHLDLLQLVDHLNRSGVDAHGFIVGGVDPRKAEYADQVHSRVREMGLERHITFAGQRRDLKEIYAISDLVVSLSRTPESFGRTVAESLAIGTPVAGYDHGGVAEILAAQFPLGLVPVGSIDALVDRALRILAEDHRPAIRKNHFTLEAMLQKTIELYGEVLDRQKSENRNHRSAA